MNSMNLLKASAAALFCLLASPFAYAAGSKSDLAEIPDAGDCKSLSFQNAIAPKWPVPLWLCHLDDKALASKSLLAYNPPVKGDYQLLADLLLRSDVPSMALAQHLKGSEPAKVLVLLGLSPYFGCQLLYETSTATEAGKFTDPCTGAEWSLQGAPFIAAFDKAAKPLLRFPFRQLAAKQIRLGIVAPELQWTELSFVPDITDSTLPVFERLLKTVLWGRLEDVKTLWPQLTEQGQGQLSESQQAQLFINAASKQQLPVLVFLKSKGLNPHAKTEMGGSAQQVAELIQSEKVLAWLKAN